ncbi:TetR/AcrR family transcriptional regulator [Nocardia yunnanensis]|uniref:TetR/AcrR family transcriptional regulator n=1 Tax=Nocardia yunnanensis TaxID=2382165 RepID=A0A386Z8V0_9NOCA|nr:TetR/AcrR family transcriptional regulator [Nocardia yunnanensis]AYF74066.1 TetR/AcrR family transcriptional regulator [Nocardia yunnanensis]
MSEKLSTTTRDRLVTAVAELMRVQGYSAITVKQITAASGAPMGSLYHHFPAGKSAIAAEALRTSGAAYIQLIPLLLDAHDDLREAVPAAFAAAAETIEQGGWMNMCPVATVAGEVADSTPEIRDVAGEVMKSWIDEGAEYLVRRGLAGEDARELMIAIICALEGAFVLSRTLRSTEPLLAAGKAMGARVSEIVGSKI